MSTFTVQYLKVVFCSILQNKFPVTSFEKAFFQEHRLMIHGDALSTPSKSPVKEELISPRSVTSSRPLTSRSDPSSRAQEEMKDLHVSNLSRPGPTFHKTCKHRRTLLSRNRSPCERPVKLRAPIIFFLLCKILLCLASCYAYTLQAL